MNSNSPGTEAEPPPRLDAEAIARLHQLDPSGQHGIVTRVLTTYESSLQRQLEVAVQARDRGDANALAGVAHMLKASSAAVGALALAELCARIERAMRGDPPPDLAPEVETLLTEAGRALAAVRAMLRS